VTAVSRGFDPLVAVDAVLASDDPELRATRAELASAWP
jgi:hypothetical protein